MSAKADIGVGDVFDKLVQNVQKALEAVAQTKVANTAAGDRPDLNHSTVRLGQRARAAPQPEPAKKKCDC